MLVLCTVIHGCLEITPRKEIGEVVPPFTLHVYSDSCTPAIVSR